MRLHVVSLPHTETTAEFCACAYTSKITKGAGMLLDQGHEVYVYAGEANEARCTEHVTIVSREEQRKWFGERAAHEQFFNVWDASAPWWKVMNRRAASKIRERAEPGDLTLILGGVCQQGLARYVHPIGVEVVEWGVGYEGVWSRACAYESYSHMHTVYAKQARGDGRYYDSVIPNFFDPEEFSHENAGDGDYLLYVGRLNRRKGLEICAEVSKATGIPLVVAGQGAITWGDGWVESEEIGIRGEGLEYVGAVGIEDRAELMAGALALLAPTLYIEPFGGVAVEAQMCGTPAITTDWGAFPETVEREWRCRTLYEFVTAVENARDADHEAIRERAHRLFSLDAIGPQYDAWFNRVRLLWDGWYWLPDKAEVAA